MARSFRIALPDGASQEVACRVIRLDVGGKLHRFAIHGSDLSDYRTGRLVCSIWSIGLDPRAVAQARINALIGAHGIAAVREQLAKFPTLNA